MQGDEGRFGDVAGYLGADGGRAEGGVSQDLGPAHGVAHQEDGHAGGGGRGGGQDGGEDGGDVVQDERGRAREAALARVRDGAAPAALVEGVRFDAVAGEGREEGVVCVACGPMTR